MLLKVDRLRFSKKYRNIKSFNSTFFIVCVFSGYTSQVSRYNSISDIV